MATFTLYVYEDNVVIVDLLTPTYSIGDVVDLSTTYTEAEILGSDSLQDLINRSYVGLKDDDGSDIRDLDSYQIAVIPDDWTRSGTDVTPTVPGDSVTMTGRFHFDQGANVASANDMTLGTDGNMFNITGNTTINAIASANWTAGSKIFLLFSGTPTVSNNVAGGVGFASIILRSGANTAMSAGFILELLFDGTYWRELAITGASSTSAQGYHPIFFLMGA